MKKLCIVLILLVGSFLSGCAGLVDTKADRKRRIRHITDLQMRMLVDDVDYFLLIDQSSSLSKYHPRVGR